MQQVWPHKTSKGKWEVCYQVFDTFAEADKYAKGYNVGPDDEPFDHLAETARMRN